MSLARCLQVCCDCHAHPHPVHASPLVVLPNHLLDDIAAQLRGGSRDAFRLTCRALWSASNRDVKTLDLYELCGWGDGSLNLPTSALAVTDRYPNITTLILPTGWRHHKITKLLASTTSTTSSSSSSRPRTWRLLTSINIHFHALSPAAATSLARLAPGLTQLTLSLDLAYEATNRQAWRIAALQHLPNLRSLVLSGPDLRPEALQVLSCLCSLSQLLLLGPSHASHPAASISALGSLSQLRSLSFHWQAGRSLTDASGLTGLTHLLELSLWLGATHEFPPCSSKPLTGMLESLGRLVGLTQLQLLQGLHLSWDLSHLRHLRHLQLLQVLGLHDSVLSEVELALLAPCCCLHTLKTDTLRLPAARGAAAPAAAAPPAAWAAAFAEQPGIIAAAAAPAAGPDGPAAAAAADPVAGALLVLSRLRQLEVNMLQLGLWQLDEVMPQLTHLGPLEATLGAKGHGVVWDLGAVSGHPRLQSLSLMIGVLGSTCRCHRSFKDATCAESLAAAVVRVILQSAGISRSGGGPRGCSMQQLVAVLSSLPQLQQLQLWGNAGRCSGRLLASILDTHSSCGSSRRSSSNGGSGNGGSSSGGSSTSGSAHGGTLYSRCCSAAGFPPDNRAAEGSSSNVAAVGITSSQHPQRGACNSSNGISRRGSSSSSCAGVAAAVGDLLSSFGARLSHRGQQQQQQQPPEAEAELVAAISGQGHQMQGPAPAAAGAANGAAAVVAAADLLSHNSTDAVASWKEGGSSSIAQCRPQQPPRLLLPPGSASSGQSGSSSANESACSSRSWMSAESSSSSTSSLAAVPPMTDVDGEAGTASCSTSVTERALLPRPHWAVAGATGAAAGPCCQPELGLLCSNCYAEHELVKQLLQGLPQLQRLQLKKCTWLPEAGRLIAAATCGRSVSQASVEVLRCS